MEEDDATSGDGIDGSQRSELLDYDGADVYGGESVDGGNGEDDDTVLMLASNDDAEQGDVAKSPYVQSTSGRLLPPPTSSPTTVKADQGSLAAFFDYCRHGKLDEVRGLLLNGFSVSTARFSANQTALHVAARHNYPKIVSIILEYETDKTFVNALDKYGNSALILSCVKWVPERSADVVGQLLRHGAVASTQKKMTGMNALMWAAYHGDARLCGLLLNENGSGECRQQLLARNLDSLSALDIAGSLTCDFDEAQKFTSEEKEKETLRQRQQRHIQCVKVFLEISSDQFRGVGATKKDAAFINLQLYWSAYLGMKEKVLELLAIGARPDWKNAKRRYQCALHASVTAPAKQHLLVDLLNHTEAGVNAADLDRNTPLHFAVMANNIPAVRALFDASKPADDSLRNIDGLLPLDYARARDMREELRRSVFSRSIGISRDMPKLMWIIPSRERNSTGSDGLSKPSSLLTMAHLLTEAGLSTDVFSCRHIDHSCEEILLVLADKKQIEILAERISYEARVIGRRQRRPFKQDQAQNYYPFSSRDSQNISMEIIKSLCNLQKKVLNGILEQPIPAHNKAEVEQVRMAWRRLFCSMPGMFREGAEVDTEAVDLFAGYAGEYASFYIAWIAHYSSWLFLIMVPGLMLIVYQIVIMVTTTVCPEASSVIQQVNETREVRTTVANTSFFFIEERNFTVNRTVLLPAEDCTLGSMETVLLPLYACFVAVWATLQVEAWKRKQSEFSYRWDMMEFEEEEGTRPEYVGDHCFDPNTGQLRKHYPSGRRCGKMFAGSPLLILLVSAVIIFFIGIQILRIAIVSSELTSAYILLGKIIIGLTNGLALTLLNGVYHLVAKALTNWENHRTRTEHENALILKTFVFQFINCNAAICYTAFYNGDYTSAMMQIIGVVISKQIIDFGKSLMLPMLLVRSKRRSVVESIKSANDASVRAKRAKTGRIDNSRYRIAPTVGRRGSGLAVSNQKDGITKVMELFMKIDDDNDGTVSCSELEQCLDEINEAYKHMHGDESGRCFRSAQHAMKHFDIDGDGFIGMPEFTRAFSTPIDDSNDPESIVRNEAELNLVLHPTTEDLISEYCISIIQWGYVVMFAAACPLAPLFAWIANVVEVKSTLLFLTEYGQRLPSRGAEGIGAWLSIVEFVGMMAVVSNCLVVYLTISSSLMEDLFGLENRPLSTRTTTTVNTTEASNTTETSVMTVLSFSGGSIASHIANFVIMKPATLCMLILVEHFLICAKLLIARFIPDQPAWVATRLQHEAWLSQKNAESSVNVIASLDLSKSMASIEGVTAKKQREFTLVNDVSIPSLSLSDV